MNAEFEALLHPRVLTHCKQLFNDGHYKHASLEAMTQVELALKEKSGVKGKFGVFLCRSLFGKGTGIKLRVPFGDDMQQEAEQLFSAAFSYYRNYAAHDGSKIDRETCLRIMVLASELLNLIGASALSFADVGGFPGLVKKGLFTNEPSVCKLLRFLDGYAFPDVVVDGLYEQLAWKGFSQDQVQAVIEVGLVECLERPYIPSAEEIKDAFAPPETIAWFELTPLGREVISNFKGMPHNKSLQAQRLGQTLS